MRLVLHLRGASEPPVLPTLPMKMLQAATDKERRSEKNGLMLQNLDPEKRTGQHTRPALGSAGGC